MFKKDFSFENLEKKKKNMFCFKSKKKKKNL